MKGCDQISMAFEHLTNCLSESQDWHSYELLPFIVLGILGVSADNLVFHDIDSSSAQVVYGAYFSKLNYYWSKHIRNKTFLGAHPVLEVLLVSLSVFINLNDYDVRYCADHTFDLYPWFPQSLHSNGGHRTHL